MDKVEDGKVNQPSGKFHIYAEEPTTIVTEKALLPDNNKFKIKISPEDEHPFDFKLTEGIYTNFGFATAIVDKYVDFIVGPGFYVTVGDEENQKKAKVNPNADTQELIEEFMKNVNFDSILREWTKEALIKGNGFLELLKDKSGKIVGLNVVNANDMYVIRDPKTGEILKYKQILNKFSNDPKDNPEFTINEIAHLAINRIAQKAYGLGIIYPSKKIIDDFLMNIKDMHTVVSRKAGAPIIAKLGAEGSEASAADIEAFGKKLQYLNNKTEWAVDWKVDIQALNMGDLGKNFEGILTFDRDMLITSSQIPEVLMGSGNIPEGLAKVQLETFTRRIQSLQAEIERVIETQIFNQIIDVNGMDDHIEFEWGQPSDSELADKILMYQGLLANISLSPGFKKAIEIELAKLLEFDIDEIDSANVDAKAEADAQMKKQADLGMKPNAPFKKNNKYHIEAFEEIDNKDYSIKEWLGFNYRDYLKHIIKFINKDSFDNLAANTNIEREAGYLTTEQIDNLKDVLKTNFKQTGSINKIADSIKEEVSPGAVYEMTDKGELVIKEGQKVLVMDEEARSSNIARTEVTRVSNEGIRGMFNDMGVEKYQWVASLTACDECAALNGNTYDINSSVVPPLHPNCRCSIIQVTE